MSSPRARLAVAAAVVALLALLVGDVGLAAARPGGGEGYSGGGGHDSGGGGGGGDGEGAAVIIELLFHLIRLCFVYPVIGLPLLGLFVGYIGYTAYKRHQDKDWDSGPPVELQQSLSLERITRLDPDFSIVLFEDFAFRLYAAAHHARGSAEALATLAPYLDPAARRVLLDRLPRGAATSVVIGAMRTFRLEVPTEPETPDGRPETIRVGLELEANYTVNGQQLYAVESWLLARDIRARSKPPRAARTFDCPNCGAPFRATATNACEYCGEVVSNGRFDWLVVQVVLSHQKPQPPPLIGDIPERGTDLPTYVQDDFDRRWLQLEKDDPGVTDAAFIARVHLVYAELNTAWTAGDLSPARGLLSDGLWDYFQYWMTAYRSQGLRNVLEGMRITHTAFSRLIRDRWYDAVTIRVWGTGRDYTIRDADGEVVRGSKRRDRAYSEYWTFIRAASRRGPVRADKVCPNCGGPLAISMGGACEHCGAHVTAGEFDWVLSKVEQDDSYRG